MASRRRLALDPALFDDQQERLHPAGEFLPGVPALLLDVPETIPQLGYGSHQFFRYYGKFPSIVGREIISRFARPGTAVLDCYEGSGTTLVEAQTAGHRAFGVDINPLAVLASAVKTSYPNVDEIRLCARQVLDRARTTGPWLPTQAPASKMNKWFSAQAQDELGRLRAALDKVPAGLTKDFLAIALLGIVRRCSTAYDGEVRPHYNPDKKPRSPYAAFQDKVQDMLAGLAEVNALRPQGVECVSVIGDNRDASVYDVIGDEQVGLLVAHPPYLNSFNYLQVFSLEFYWAEDWPTVWGDYSPAQAKAAEHKAWPAINPSVVTSYYADFAATMKAATSRLAAGGVLAVVVGDATIRGQLEPVHQKMADQLVASGLDPVEVWFRTTHYGIGKYAYAHRADYHGDAEKKDAIMFFQVPA